MTRVAPQLITVTRNGKRSDAVALATKHGFMFVFDRVTGVPVFPVEERPVRKSEVPGEQDAEVILNSLQHSAFSIQNCESPIPERISTIVWPEPTTLFFCFRRNLTRYCIGPVGALPGMSVE